MKLSPILRLIAATTLIRLAFAATTGLGVDESYMVTAGRVLSLGYFDHPPASWWLSWGASHLLGTEAPVVVRLPFILLFALSQFLVWRIGCVIADRRAGYWAAVALNVSPVFGVTTASWVLPDGPLDTALLGAALCLLYALPASGRRAMGWWAAAGVCAGLALFSKYSAVLTIAGAFLYLAVDPAHRRWLLRPHPYIAAILAVLVFSPVPIWNATHGWASFAFQGDRATGFRFRPLMPLQTLGGEALFVLPWIWMPMMILLAQGFRRGAVWSHRLLCCLAAPPIVVFALISAWSSQRILYHWAAPGYLMLFPLLGERIAGRLDRAWVRRLVAGSAALVLVAVTVVATQIQFDWLGGRLATVMRNDPTAEGLDWTSVREELRARGLLAPGAVVAALNWRDAGKIGYALGPDVTMLCLNADSRQLGFADPVRAFAGRDVIVVVVDPNPRAVDEAKTWFRSVEVLQPASVVSDGRVLRTVTVLRGEGLGTGGAPGQKRETHLVIPE
jgi:4-amino-4-deoxy-L-arabinose transferase-like glycosyltransferase